VGAILLQKQKKTAVIGARFMFNLVACKTVDKDKSRSGKREYIQCYKSIEHPDLESKVPEGSTKADTIFEGFNVIHSSKTETEVLYFLECDLQISMNIVK
jgi:hypothetical protein